MFDFAWTEIALIGVVALVAIGPKDLPVAIKAVAGAIKKARRMAGEFQGHVDEMVREANLHEVRDQFNELRNFDVKSQLAKAVDSDGSIRATFAENPLSPSSWTPDPVTTAAADVTTPPATEVLPDPVPDPVALAHDAPSFIPPLDAAEHRPKPMMVPEPAPAFIPPSDAARGSAGLSSTV
jgi:sec-independent protein translocase protein TatB